MSHTTADLGVTGYKNWRNSLVPLPDGTVIKNLEHYSGLISRYDMKEGQEFVIESTSIRPDAKVYTLRLAKGKKKEYWNIEGIARRIIDGQMKVVG